MIEENKDYPFRGNDDKQYEVTCDQCGHNEEFEVFSWRTLIEVIKISGWIIKNVDNSEWFHYCSKTCEAKADFS